MALSSTSTSSIFLPSACIWSVLHAAELDDAFGVVVEAHGFDGDGVPFGVIRDEEDETILHHFGAGVGGEWLIW